MSTKVKVLVSPAPEPTRISDLEKGDYFVFSEDNKDVPYIYLMSDKQYVSLQSGTILSRPRENETTYLTKVIRMATVEINGTR